MKNSFRFSGLIITTLAIAVLPLSSRADIVAAGGSAVIADPPADIRVHHWRSDTEARVWLERRTTLNAPVAVDDVDTGIAFGDGVDGAPGTIPASSYIDSYMLRTDPITQGGVNFEGFIIFDQPVLGVMFTKATLDASDDILARPGVTYNDNDDRGLDHHNAQFDALTISADRLRIDFAFRTFAGTAGTDDVRIITPAPEPAQGDMNCDGLINAQDIDGFIDALFGDADAYDAYLHSFAEYHPCSMLNADFSGDGLVNAQDIDGFATALFGG